MARNRKDRLEQAIEDALVPGAFIGYRGSWNFVENLEAVKTELDALVKQGRAARAVGLYETFIAGCYEKSEEIDDSGGSFGMFVGELFCGWIRARQGRQADPVETAELLLTWMEDDDYGYCYRLEADAAKAFNRKGLAAFEQVVRREWMTDRQESKAAKQATPSRKRRAVEILKAIYTKRRDAGAYVSLCEEAGELAPKDCEAVAEICLKQRLPEDALVWVEQGLGLEENGRWPNRSSYRLPEMRREILKELGRGEDAIASAWEAYRKHPSIYGYEELMKYVPKGDRPCWHAKALAGLGGAHLSGRIELLVGTREWKLLAEVIEQAGRDELVALSHQTAEPAAHGLAKAHPLQAAKLYLALGLRTLEAKKSKHYGAALEQLETARDILLAEGRTGEWEDIVSQIRERHRRKTSFMPGFERLVSGHRSGDEPSFLDKARKKWEQKRRRGSRESMPG